MSTEEKTDVGPSAKPADTMYERVYWDAQAALDEVLGPDEEDGAGGGLVAEIYLLADQRDAARAEVERLTPIAEAARAVREASRHPGGGSLARADRALIAAVDAFNPEETD